MTPTGHRQATQRAQSSPMDRSRTHRPLKAASLWRSSLMAMSFTGFLLVTSPTHTAGGPSEPASPSPALVRSAAYGSGYESRRFNRSAGDVCSPQTRRGQRAFGDPKQGASGTACSTNTDQGSALGTRPGKPSEVHKNLVSNPGEISRPGSF